MSSFGFDFACYFSFLSLRFQKGFSRFRRHRNDWSDRGQVKQEKDEGNAGRAKMVSRTEKAGRKRGVLPIAS